MVALPGAASPTGAPFVRIVSCNPLEVPGPDVAPRLLRACPPTTARQWAAFRAEYDRTHRRDVGRLQRLGAASRARPPCPTWSSSTRPRDLNLYVYPEALDYTDARPLDATLAPAGLERPRTTDAAFELPQSSATGRRTARSSISRLARSAAPTWT